MKTRDPHFSFANGLQTTQPEEDTRIFWFPTFQNVRTTRNGLRRRDGIVPLATIDASPNSGQFEAGEYATCPAHATQWRVKTHWTVECLVQPEAFAAGTDYGILGFSDSAKAPFRLYYDCDTNDVATLKADVRDGGGSVTVALSATHDVDAIVPIQLVRDGSTIYLRAFGDEEATGTLAEGADLDLTGLFRIGADHTDDFVGLIDYVRVQTIVKADQRMGWFRLPNPRAKSVVFDAVCNASNGWVLDRSRYENHAEITGTVTSFPSILTASSLVQNISTLRTPSGLRRLLVTCAGQRYEGVI